VVTDDRSRKERTLGSPGRRKRGSRTTRYCEKDQSLSRRSRSQKGRPWEKKKGFFLLNWPGEGQKVRRGFFLFGKRVKPDTPGVENQRKRSTARVDPCERQNQKIQQRKTQKTENLKLSLNKASRKSEMERLNNKRRATWGGGGNKNSKLRILCGTFRQEKANKLTRNGGGSEKRKPDKRKKKKRGGSRTAWRGTDKKFEPRFVRELED